MAKKNAPAPPEGENAEAEAKAAAEKKAAEEKAEAEKKAKAEAEAKAAAEAKAKEEAEAKAAAEKKAAEEAAAADVVVTWPGVPEKMIGEDRFRSFDPSAGVWFFLSHKRQLQIRDPRWQKPTERNAAKETPCDMITFADNGLRVTEADLAEALVKDYNLTILRGAPVHFNPVASAAEFQKTTTAQKVTVPGKSLSVVNVKPEVTAQPTAGGAHAPAPPAGG